MTMDFYKMPESSRKAIEALAARELKPLRTLAPAGHAEPEPTFARMTLLELDEEWWRVVVTDPMDWENPDERDEILTLIAEEWERRNPPADWESR